jgi:hypothetical protein
VGLNFLMWYHVIAGHIFKRELLNPVAQLLNPVAHANTCISTTTRLELVIRIGRIIVGVP